MADWFARDADLDPVVFAERVQDYLRALRAAEPALAPFHLPKGRFGVDRERVAADLEPAAFARYVDRKGLLFTLFTLAGDAGISFNPGFAETRASGRTNITACRGLTTEQLRVALRVSLEFFEADAGGIRPDDYENPPDCWRFWLFWERNPGGPTPIPDVRPYGTPSHTEPWLGGRLSIWPEYAPDGELARALRAET